MIPEWLNAPLLLSDTSDPRIWMVERDFGFRDSRGREWWARAGRYTDGPSIPALACLITGPAMQCPATRGGVLHDVAYQDHARSRLQADRMLLACCRLRGMSEGESLAIYQAVRTFGRDAWFGRGKWMQDAVAGIQRARAGEDARMYA